jgi:hypothetical protein
MIVPITGVKVGHRQPHTNRPSLTAGAF